MDKSQHVCFMSSCGCDRPVGRQPVDDHNQCHYPDDINVLSSNFTDGVL